MPEDFTCQLGASQGIWGVSGLTKGAFHLTELTGQTGHLEGITLQQIQINTLQG